MIKLPKISLIIIVILSCLTGSSIILSQTNTHFNSAQPYWLEWTVQSDQKNPWEIWSGSVSWAEKPTELDMIWGYYHEKWNKRKLAGDDLFKIIDHKQIKRDPNHKVEPYPTLKTDQQKQEFLNRYSRSLIVRVQVAGKYVDMFLEDGWKVISS